MTKLSFLIIRITHTLIYNYSHMSSNTLCAKLHQCQRSQILSFHSDQTGLYQTRQFNTRLLTPIYVLTHIQILICTFQEYYSAVDIPPEQEGGKNVMLTLMLLFYAGICAMCQQFQLFYCYSQSFNYLSLVLNQVMGSNFKCIRYKRFINSN